MPNQLRLLAQLDALHLTLSARIKQAELDTLRVLGKKRKVNALAIPSGSTRERFPRPDRANR
jgi:hypothetical protein